MRSANQNTKPSKPEQQYRQAYTRLVESDPNRFHRTESRDPAYPTGQPVTFRMGSRHYAGTILCVRKLPISGETSEVLVDYGLSTTWVPAHTLDFVKAEYCNYLRRGLIEVLRPEARQ